MKNRIQQFRAVEDRVLSAAPNDEGQPWDAPDGEHFPEPFISSGHALFDKVATDSGAVFEFGGSEAANATPMDGSRPAFIVMPRPEYFQSPDAYRRIVAHELVHWTGAREQLDRPKGSADPWSRLLGIVPPGYAREELVAELGSALLLDAVGLPVPAESIADYLENWQASMGEAERAAAVTWARARAEEAVEFLLNRAGM